MSCPEVWSLISSQIRPWKTMSGVEVNDAVLSVALQQYDGFLCPVAKAVCSLGGMGYAKRSTKTALAVVWPKMKAPRVTRSTP